MPDCPLCATFFGIVMHKICPLMYVFVLLKTSRGKLDNCQLFLRHCRNVETVVINALLNDEPLKVKNQQLTLPSVSHEKTMPKNIHFLKMFFFQAWWRYTIQEAMESFAFPDNL